MNYKQYNDYELIYKVQENDEESKSILFEKYTPIICNIASRFYQKYSNYGYEYGDFVQEGRIAFYRALCSYDENQNILFYTFAVVCIKRSLSTFCRNISRTHNLSVNYFVDIDDCNIVDKRSDIYGMLCDHEIQDIIKDVIFSLPLEAGAIIELKWNGFTYREIGELLELPSSTVEFKSRKARKNLHSLIQKYLYR